MDVINVLLLFLIGAASAVFGSIVGLGGGVIIVPSLIYLGDFLLGKELGTPIVVGTSLAVLIVTAASSTMSYAKQRRVDFRSGWLFFAASGPASIIGALLTNRFSPSGFSLAFGLFLLLMAALLIARDYFKPLHIEWRINRTYTDAAGTTTTYGYNIVPALAIGFGVGLISGLFGIGGGSLFVPAMVLLFRYPPHIATATSMFVIFLSSILGSTTKVYLGEVDWLLVAILAPGAWIGGKAGAWITSRMSGKMLMWVLRVSFLVLAVRMIAEGLLMG